MITNKGKAVVAKYLIGQTPAYASYLAIGCGPNPLLPSTTPGDYSAKETLDFETLRVPIISRGYVNENGVSKLVLTAQLPAESRYGITEVGIYPALSNPTALNNDSRMLLNFDSNESWTLRNSSTETSEPVVEGSINLTTPAAVIANSLDSVFTNQSRILTNEVPRNGATSVVVPGDVTTFTGSTPTGGSYLVLSNPGIDLSNNSVSDKLKIAFSVIPKTIPGSVTGTAKIVVEFGNQQGIGTGGYARATYEVALADDKRYFTDSIDIADIVTSSFSWQEATYIKVFVYADSDYLVALDGLRVDNVSSQSPIYGLVGYTVIRNMLTTTGGTSGAVPAVKDKDKTSLIEFRFQVAIA